MDTFRDGLAGLEISPSPLVHPLPITPYSLVRLLVLATANLVEDQELAKISLFNLKSMDHSYAIHR